MTLAKEQTEMKITNSTDNLAATASFRLTDEECRVLAFRSNRERRTVSQPLRLLLRELLPAGA
jgi:hypothetical protein